MPQICDAGLSPAPLYSEAQGRRQCHQAALSQAAQVPARSLAAQSHPQHKEEQLWPCAGSTMQRTEEQPCSCARSSTQHPADSSIVEPQAPQVAAESRYVGTMPQHRQTPAPCLLFRGRGPRADRKSVV